MSFVKRSATRLSCLVFVLAAFLPAVAVAQNYSFTNIDYPGATNTYPEQ